MLTLGDLMTHHTDQLPCTATLGEAADLMLHSRISSVIIVAHESVAGIVTERDVVHAMRTHQSKSLPITEIMTSPVITAPVGQDFRSAYQMAASHGIRHLVIVDAENRPCGVVTETDIRRHLGLDFFRHLNNVDALMERDFPRLAPDLPLDEALAIMETQRASCVLVVEDDQPVGIVTERDIVRLFLGQTGNPCLRDVMTSPVSTVPVDASLADAAQRMLDARIRHLGVLDAEGHLCGLLTEHDLMRPLELDLVDDALVERAALENLHDEAQERLSLVMQAVNDGIWDFNIPTDRITCNARVFEMLGFPPDAFIITQSVWRSFIHPDDLAGMLDQYVASEQPGGPIFDAEYRLQQRNGNWLWVQSRGQVVHWAADGQPLRRVGTITDISRRKAAEDALHMRESYQRAVLDNFPFQVWLKDTDSRFLAVNAPFARNAGSLNAEELVGKTDFDLWPAAQAERHLDSDRRVMAERRQRIGEDLVFRGDQRVWLETYKAPVVGTDGTLFGSVGFARDISEKKRSEEAMLLRNAALAGLIRNEPLRGILDLIALSVEAEMPEWTCSILLLDDDGVHLRHGAAPRLPEDYCQAVDGLAIGEGVGSCGTAAFRRERVISSDVFSDPAWAPFLDWARQVGFAACWSEPVFGPEGRVLGTFGVYHATPAEPGDSDIEHLSQAAQLTSLVLSHQQNTARLQASQATFRGILDSISEAFLILDQEGNCLDINTGGERLFHHARADLLGQSYAQISAPGLNDPQQIGIAMFGVIEGRAHHGEYWAVDAYNRGFPVEVHMHPGTYFGRPAIIVSVQDITERREAAIRLEIEHDLAQALASGLGRDAILERILDNALRFPEFEAGGIYWLAGNGGYQLMAHRGLSAPFVAATAEYPVHSVQAGIVREGEIVCSCRGDCDNENCRQLIEQPIMAEEGLHCLLIMPIVLDGRPLACLNLAGRQARHISPATRNSLLALGSTFGHTLLRLQAMEESQRLQANLSGLFDTIDDFIFILDASGHIVHHNRAVSENLGYAAEFLLGRPVLCVHPEGVHQEASQVIAEMLAGQRSTCPLPLLRADGSQIMVETRVVSGYWNGKPAMFGISRDITERLQAEERQRLVASVFEHAHEGIMITDPRGILVEINDTFTELTGYSRSEAIGHSADLLKSGHHGPEFYQAMWSSIRSEGYWQGEVWNRKKDGEIFVELLTISCVRDQGGHITHYVGMFSDITLQKQNQERLEHLAHFDALTQLPNRMLLGDRMQLAMAQTERTGKLLAVCYLDLDGFKPVNDELGHAAGDRLLIDVAQRLKVCVRAGDTVARLGGDEFVLLISSIENEHECDRAVSRVIASLSAPFSVANRDISISASIGVTLYPHDGADSDTLLRHADQAMYAAKQAGRNRYHLFDPESDRRARSRREEIGRIREALEHNEFVLYYQPKVDMRQGKVIGAEALIRWIHPQRGLVSPMEFLPAIEGSEFSITLGDWVIAEALRQLDTWHAEGLDLSVSVNIAGNHLQTFNFAERLGELLAEHPNVPASRLELEVLETAALDDMAQVTAIFEACRALGVSFALDDFGTGYSSLTYFRRLPADLLKIDQSFVRDMLDDPDDLAIVEGVIGLTQAFRRKVIAEGVETAEHGMVLLQLGCDLAQGYGIARPMPAANVLGWVQNFQPDPVWSASASFQWSREDLPMLVAEADHTRWRKNLLNWLEDSSGKVPLPARDSGNCRFGRWYTGPTRPRYAQYDSFIALETIHHRIHVLGDELITLRQQGQTADIPAKRAELEQLSSELSDTIQMLQAEVLLSHQGNQPLSF